MIFTTESSIGPRLVDALYTEAMLLADESRAYFDMGSADERAALPALSRVLLSCEAMRITTRLMHIVAWLLTRRAIEAGKIAACPTREPARKLGKADDSDPVKYAGLPHAARVLIETSQTLYARVARLDAGTSAGMVTSPARKLLDRLERAF